MIGLSMQDEVTTSTHTVREDDNVPADYTYAATSSETPIVVLRSRSLLQ